VRDTQLERAEDYLKGQILYRERAGKLRPTEQKVAAQRE
jgi:hypothetical protein